MSCFKNTTTQGLPYLYISNTDNILTFPSPFFCTNEQNFLLAFILRFILSKCINWKKSEKVTPVTELVYILYNIYLSDMTYGWPRKTRDWQRNSSLHLCIAKQWDVTDSFTFFDFSTFQVVTMLLKIMTKPKAKAWMSHTQTITLLLNI